MDTRPIGVFDSGIGGLTVVKCITEQLPKENIVYFGDIARLPYGTKSIATICKFTEQTVNFLLKQDVKAIVIACNTISAVAKDVVTALAKNIPVLDVISAGAQASCKTNKNGLIGVIATPATVNSNAYPNAIQYINPTVKVFQKACTMFVPLIEDGFINHPALELIANEYLSDMLHYNIDTLILGCTHYPIISPTIKKIMGNTTLIDPATDTVQELKIILTQLNLLNQQQNTKHKFYVTEVSPNFTKIGNLFLNTQLTTPQLINLD